MHERRMTAWHDRGQGAARLAGRGFSPLLAPVLASVLVATSLAAGRAAAADMAAVRTPAVQREPLPLPAAIRSLPVLARPAARPAGAALGDARLDELRGGTETPWSDMRLDGTVGGNTAVNVVSGANHITDGAFSNASGLPMVIQNSGSNVLIQNATIVNVQIR